MNQQDAKQFDIFAVVTVATGVLVLRTPGAKVAGDCTVWEEAKELMDFMTNDNLFTHQLPRAADEVSPYLKQWYPWLESLEARFREIMQDQSIDKATGCETMRQHVREVSNLFASIIDRDGVPIHVLDVWPMPQDDHDYRDPIEEAIEMRGGDASSVIAINLTEETPPSDVGDINWKVD